MLLEKTRTIIPYLVSVLGIFSDYLTTNIGLRLGLREINVSYNPVLALIIFWGALTFLNLTLQNKRLLNMSRNILSYTSFLGALNNTLVITGIFSGLKV